ncbi:MAG: hypothetical protein VXX13_12360 [Pseudomonadota bacterium]|nr:hypothetical protein [Pseudomonadota bacterium]
MGETVQAMGGEGLQIQQHRVGGQNHRAGGRAGVHEQRRAGDHRQGADENIEIDFKQARQRLGGQDPGPVETAADPPQMMAQ